MADLKTPTGDLYKVADLQRWALEKFLADRGIDPATHTADHFSIIKADVGLALTVLSITPIAPKVTAPDPQNVEFPLVKK
jgi:hypothetical protein